MMRNIAAFMVMALVVAVRGEPISIDLVGGCICSDFTWFTFLPGRRSVLVGDCLARDSADDLVFCYVHQPNTCIDAQPSSKFLNMDISKVACGCLVGPNGFCLPPNPITPVFAPRNAAGSGRRRQHITDEKLEDADDVVNEEDLAMDAAFHIHVTDHDEAREIPVVSSHEY